MKVDARLAKTSDAPAIAKIYNFYILNMPQTFETEPVTAAIMQERMGGLVMYPWLVAESEGRVIGYCYASQHRPRSGYRWAVDVSVYLAPDYVGRGIGRALYSQLFPLLIQQGFSAAYAGIALPNTASIGLHESFDFKLVGVYEKVGVKLGQWLDVGWWQKQLNERAIPMSEPTPLSRL